MEVSLPECVHAHTQCQRSAKQIGKTKDNRKSSDHVIKDLCSQDTYDLESILSMLAYSNYLVIK